MQNKVWRHANCKQQTPGGVRYVILVQATRPRRDSMTQPLKAHMQDQLKVWTELVYDLAFAAISRKIQQQLDCDSCNVEDIYLLRQDILWTCSTMNCVSVLRHDE